MLLLRPMVPIVCSYCVAAVGVPCMCDGRQGNDPDEVRMKLGISRTLVSQCWVKTPGV